jgi:hypothetical protein
MQLSFRNPILWDVTLRLWLRVFRRFGRTCRLNFQGFKGAFHVDYLRRRRQFLRWVGNYLVRDTSSHSTGNESSITPLFKHQISLNYHSAYENAVRECEHGYYVTAYIYKYLILRTLLIAAVLKITYRQIFSLMYLKHKFDSGFMWSLSPFVTFKKFGALNLDWLRYFSLSLPREFFTRISTKERHSSVQSFVFICFSACTRSSFLEMGRSAAVSHALHSLPQGRRNTRNFRLQSYCFNNMFNSELCHSNAKHKYLSLRSFVTVHNRS